MGRLRSLLCRNWRDECPAAAWLEVRFPSFQPHKRTSTVGTANRCIEASLRHPPIATLPHTTCASKLSMQFAPKRL